MTDEQKVRIALDIVIRVMEDLESGEAGCQYCTPAETERLKVEIEQLKRERDAAVPVVRCKDCLWFKSNDGCPLAASEYFQDGKLLPHENDFCSYGERRNEDATD